MAVEAFSRHRWYLDTPCPAGSWAPCPRPRQESLFQGGAATHKLLTGARSLACLDPIVDKSTPMIEANRERRGWVTNLTTPGSLDLTITGPCEDPARQTICGGADTAPNQEACVVRGSRCIWHSDANAHSLFRRLHVQREFSRTTRQSEGFVALPRTCTVGVRTWICGNTHGGKRVPPHGYSLSV